jgi:hypothetical protein
MIQVPGVVPAQAPVRARGLVVSLAQAVVVSPALAAGVVVSPALAAGVVVSPALTAVVVVSPAVAVPDSARMQVVPAGLVLPLPRPP